MSSQEDEFGFEELGSEASQKVTTTEVDYDPNRFRVLKSSEIMKRSMAEIAKVKAVVDDTISENEIRILLNDHRWDVERFLEKFYTDENFASSLQKVETIHIDAPVNKENSPPKPDANDLSQFRRITRSIARKREASGQLLFELGEPSVQRRKVQISVLGSSSQNKSPEPSQSQPSTQTLCEICFDPIGKKFHTWKCKHKFCCECFKNYLNEKITCNGLNATFQCPGFKCPIILTDIEIMKALDKAQVDKYMQIITNQYVQCNRMLRWCPGKDCTYAIQVFDTVIQPAIRCLCGNHFCFSCSHYVHDLISCELVKEFELLRSKDFESANWIAENCKQCPKCKTEINKNGGCNHMTCSKCSHQFCWVCFDNWNTHNYTPCKGLKVDPKGDFKISTRRLVSYVSKYVNMIDSIEKDETNYKKYVQVQEQIADDTEGWYKIDFIKEATDWIVKCRHLICDSFVLEFFMEDPDNTHWLSFEMSLRDLERRTEALSKMMENDITSHNMHEMKQTIYTNVSCCKSLYNAVYEKAKEGFQNDLWKKVAR